MRIAVVGGYGYGLTIFPPRMPEPGETLPGATFVATPGGKASNQAVAAARLGASVSLFTAVGTDAYGQDGRSLWETEGVDASSVRTVEGASMVGVIVVEPSGENRIMLAGGALDALVVDDLDGFVRSVAAADVLLISTEIPVAVVAAAVQLGRDHGVRTILNPAPVLDFPGEALSSVDFLTPNRSEARQLLDGEAEDSEEHLALRLHERTGASVVLTLGSDGAIVVDDDGSPTHVAAERVDTVRDTTGAGDSFNGALARGLAAGDSLQDAVGLAMRAGAFTVQRIGVIPALPTRAEVGLK